MDLPGGPEGRVLDTFWAPPLAQRGPSWASALREIRASLAALDSRPLGDPLHFTLLYLRWVTPGASTARTCSSCTSGSRRLSKMREPSPSTTGTTWSSSSSSSPAARYCCTTWAAAPKDDVFAVGSLPCPFECGLDSVGDEVKRGSSLHHHGI